MSHRPTSHLLPASNPWIFIVVLKNEMFSILRGNSQSQESGSEAREEMYIFRQTRKVSLVFAAVAPELSCIQRSEVDTHTFLLCIVQ